jgi:hypothetical protein
MISDGMDIGDVWSGIAFTSAAGYRSVCQDLIRGWCYAGADRERLKGRRITVATITVRIIELAGFC